MDSPLVTPPRLCTLRTWIVSHVCSCTRCAQDTQAHPRAEPHFALSGQACMYAHTLIRALAARSNAASGFVLAHVCALMFVSQVSTRVRTCLRGCEGAGSWPASLVHGCRELERDWSLGPGREAPAGLPAGTPQEAQPSLVAGLLSCSWAPRHKRGLHSRWHIRVPVLQGRRQEQLRAPS